MVFGNNINKGELDGSYLNIILLKKLLSIKKYKPCKGTVAIYSNRNLRKVILCHFFFYGTVVTAVIIPPLIVILATSPLPPPPNV